MLYPSSTASAYPAQTAWSPLPTYYTPYAARSVLLMPSLAMYPGPASPHHITPQTSTPKGPHQTSEGDTASSSSPEGNTSSSHTEGSSKSISSSPKSEAEEPHQDDQPINLSFIPKRPWEDREEKIEQQVPETDRHDQTSPTHVSGTHVSGSREQPIYPHISGGREQPPYPHVSSGTESPYPPVSSGREPPNTPVNRGREQSTYPSYDMASYYGMYQRLNPYIPPDRPPFMYSMPPHWTY